MQKKIIALAVAGLSATAFAQSNVTVYGLVDVGYAHVEADGKTASSRIDSGLLAGSRIGFKGVEDLGNGLKAAFVLEYALAATSNTGVGVADTGWSSTLARQQYVGLVGDFGTVVAGRLQTAGYDWACAYNPVAGGAFDTAGKLGASSLLACGSAGRADNAVAYISPTFGGGFTVAYNHSRVTEDATVNGAAVGGQADDAYANLLHVTYANGPLAAGLVWAKINMAHTAISDDVREYGIGASYDFGVAKLYGNYQNKKADNAATGNNDSKWSLSVGVPVSAAGTVLVSYAKNNIDSTAADDDSKAWALAYTHALSKRTTAYAGYTHVTNSSAGTAGILGGATTTTSFLPTAGGSATIYGAGISHKF